MHPLGHYIGNARRVHPPHHFPPQLSRLPFIDKYCTGRCPAADLLHFPHARARTFFNAAFNDLGSPHMPCRQPPAPAPIPNPIHNPEPNPFFHFFTAWKCRGFCFPLLLFRWFFYIVLFVWLPRSCIAVQLLLMLLCPNVLQCAGMCCCCCCSWYFCWRCCSCCSWQWSVTGTTIAGGSDGRGGPTVRFILKNLNASKKF